MVPRVALFLIFLYLVSPAWGKGLGTLGVGDLKCVSLVDPLGIDNKAPTFSWRLISDGRNVKQVAYEVRVGLDSSQLKKGRNLLWKSGEVHTDQSVFIPYGGTPLRSATTYYWQVKVRDNHGRSSEWSKVAYWSMGLLSPTDWKAKWIIQGRSQDPSDATVPLFRQEFKVQKKVKSAVAYITSLGLYEAFINGKRIGDAYFTPGWTSENRLQYQVYDVTSLVNAGTNAVGVMLGYGWYKSPLGWGVKFNRDIKGRQLALLFQMELVYTDGTRELVVSDTGWKQYVGAIQRSEIYAGEIIDARAEPESWLNRGYDKASWHAVDIAHYDKSRLTASGSEPVRRREAISPQSISVTADGDWLIDFGQNMTGYVVARLSGFPGDTVVVEHAEILDRYGEFYTENLRTATATNVFILAGNREEEFAPHFTFQGFRYIRVKGLRQAPKEADFTAYALYSDVAETGTFACSHPLINQLQQNIVWGQRSNFLDVPTDCPQRDERLGWTGDAQVFGSTAAYNMNVHRFFVKWLKDLALDQLENGSVPFVIPHVLDDSVSSGAAGWADAATIVPWQMYLAYGDKQILVDQYASMKAWVDYMQNQAKNYLWKPRTRQTGDWLYYVPQHFLDAAAKSAFTSTHLIAQSFFAHSTSLLAKIAALLGNEADAASYTALLNHVIQAFQDEYVTMNGNLISETQTAYVLALNFGLIPSDRVASVVERLVQNIEDYGGHLTTGFIGTPYLCFVLANHGHLDLAYKLLMNETYPSWLYPVTKGATTVWERWDGIRPDGSFQNPDMNSFNHYAYGAIGNWMYTTIAGINTDSVQVGYKKSIIRPQPGGGLTYANGSLMTYYGKLGVDWQIDRGRFSLAAEIPPNTSALVYFPITGDDLISENGRSLSSAPGILSISHQDNYTIVEVGSGKYSFSANLGFGGNTHN